MLIQIHLLQNYAPSNLNRDDTGAPKDAIFGGKKRGRISSQCLKRSIRRSEIFAEAFEKDKLLGVRTKLLPTMIEEELKKLNADEKAILAIQGRVPELGRESGKKKEEEAEEEGAEGAPEAEKETETKQLIFIGRNEVPVMAKKLLKMYTELGADKWKKAKIQDIAKELGESQPKSVDIAMFGRMTTSGAFRDVEAAVQVAHTLSTNALAAEFDYFTAVDDLSGETGAGMIGDVEFNSATYYKYLNIHWEELVKNLGGDIAVARKAALALLEAAMFAQPSGKQNTFAAFSLPDFVLLEVSGRNLPVSYANAFLKPVAATHEKSLMQVSVEKLADYLQRVSQTYDLKPQRAWLSLEEEKVPDAEKMASLANLKGWLAKLLPAEG